MRALLRRSAALKKGGALGLTPPNFDPSQLSGLALWLDATSLSALADGAAVSSWTDKSGNGRDASASGGARPTYRTTSAVTALPPSGRPVVQFDGNLSTLSLASDPAPTVPLSVFLVCNKPVVSSNYWTVFRTNVFQMLLRLNSSDVWGTYEGTDTPAVNVSTGYRCLSVVRRASDIDLVTDGSVITRTATATAGPQSPTVGSNNGGQFSQTNIGELVVYGRAVTAAERQQVEGYLKSKWGTP